MRTSIIIAVASTIACMLCLRAADDNKPAVGKQDQPIEFKVMRTLENSKDVLGVCFSPDGKVIAGIDWPVEYRCVRMWNALTGKEISLKNKPVGHKTDAILNIAFLDSRTLATTNGSPVVRMWSYPEGEELPSLEFKRRVYLMATAPGMIAMGTSPDGGDYNTLSLATGPPWKVKWTANIPPKKGKTPFGPNSLAFSPDRKKLAVGMDDIMQVRVYSVEDGKLLSLIDDEKLALNQPYVAYSPTGRDLAFASGWAFGIEHAYWLGIWDADLSIRRHQPGWDFNPDEKGAQARGCLFTADGKTIIVPCANRTIRLYEVENGGLREISRLPILEWGHYELSPDGRLLAAKSETGMLLFDWRTIKNPISGTWNAERLKKLWEDLSSRDSGIGYRAVVVLVSAPEKAIVLLREKLKPAVMPEADKVKTWIRELGDDEYAVREAATVKLAQIAELVEPQLRAALKDDLLERRNRAGRLLLGFDREILRDLRAVEIMEYLDSPASRELLKKLASGAHQARLTGDAKASLERLIAREQSH